MDHNAGANRGVTRRNVRPRSEDCRLRSDETNRGERLGRKKEMGGHSCRQVHKYLVLSMALIVSVTRCFGYFEIAKPYHYIPQDKRPGVYPRAVQWEHLDLSYGSWRLELEAERSRCRVLDPAYYRNTQRQVKGMSSRPERPEEEGRADPFETEECKAQAKWQLTTYPTCNSLHELGIADFGTNETRLNRLANGYWRDVFTIDFLNRFRYVLKTQRYQHSFVERNFDRSRRDAVTAERLTSSPYISDIYGFCGNSLLSEFGDGGDITRAIWSKGHNLTKLEELVLATQAATGLAALHEFPIAHTDITPGQFIKVGNRYKLSDFNRARFLRWNVKKDEPCGYRVEHNPGRNRSPEEYRYALQSEKVDVYSLGNIYYMLLQKEWPFMDVDEKEARKLVKQGYRPSFDTEVWNSTDPVDQALKEAMFMCHEQEPEDRASAQQIETYLKEKLLELFPNTTSF